MNIIICIKAVPEFSEVKFDEEKGTMIREGISFMINPFDLYALEEGLRLRDSHEGKVTVISMGPLSVKEILREAIAMGADSALLLSDQAFAGSDTWATSFTLSQAIKKIEEVDLVLCGKQAIDGDTAQVGPGVAQNLNIPYVTFVRKIEELKDGKIKVERLMENGYEVIETVLPCLLTVVKEINEPRLPTLKGKLRAKKAEIEVWGLESLGGDSKSYGQQSSPTQVIRIFKPEVRRSGEIFTGTVEEQVKALTQRLKEREII